MSDRDDVIIIDPDERGGQLGTTDDERLLAMLIYVTSFFTTIIGPIIIWLIKREESSFIDFHGKEYLNFIISYFVYGIVAGLSVLILIGFILAPIVGVAAFVFTIIAAVKAFNGERYQIPFIFRIIK
ncbi:DUF4870 domain-containing protein [Pseudogracilibacillus auburnensis]|uniref:Tic20 family protein n=1 Tax=Pseudogracilibacillus auburnensis TaxID=1494959 RepID=A0A2V3W7N8_9BACI|nr:DUF4870 domain-containing protein [Pseudogracilibacillus auburnensis]MBO1003642.1 DUF4870 domain-containing protein [Pseudogracilibacillus auburnensis]PXW90347.1 hypothetical protein DFR56_101259 [Pseudogracilibacillus auburnensis]